MIVVRVGSSRKSGGQVVEAVRMAGWMARRGKGRGSRSSWRMRPPGRGSYSPIEPSGFDV